VTTDANEGAEFFVFPDVLVANNFSLTEYITQLFPRLSATQIRTAVGLYSKIGSTSVLTKLRKSWESVSFRFHPSRKRNDN
jgi:hypothetical protein